MWLLKNKYFTLIELIVVIVVIGILSAIVIPNISSYKEEAEEKSILADARNIQSAVDIFMMKNDSKTPTKDTPTIGYPQVIETYAMKPDYLRNLPKTKKAKFWLDHNNTVWASTVDAPQNVNYTEGKVTWNTVEGAVTYKIYKTTTDLLSSMHRYKEFDLLEEVKPSKKTVQEKEISLLDEGTYLVSAVDKYGFEGPVVRVNSPYEGYGDGPEKDLTIDFLTKPRNQKPKAVLNYLPTEKVDTLTKITWDHQASIDPEKDAIVDVEWKLNNIPLDQMPQTLPVGTHVVQMRVQDAKMNWSEWESVTIQVDQGRFTPTVISNTKTFSKLTGSVLDLMILNHEDNVEVFSTPDQTRLFREVFDKEGTRISYTQIIGSMGNVFNSNISNADEKGNRYLFNRAGQIYIIHPDGSSSLFGDFVGNLNSSPEIYKVSIAVDGGEIFLAYSTDRGNGRMRTAMIDIPTKKIKWIKSGVDQYVSGFTRSDIVLDSEYLYVTVLTYYEDGRPSNVIQKINRATGNLVQAYTIPQGYENYNRSVAGVDLNGNVWVTQSLYRPSSEKMKLYRVKFDSSGSPSATQTVMYGDAVIQRADAIHRQKDGTLRIFGYGPSNTVQMVTFQ